MCSQLSLATARAGRARVPRERAVPSVLLVCSIWYLIGYLYHTARRKAAAAAPAPEPEAAKPAAKAGHPLFQTRQQQLSSLPSRKSAGQGFHGSEPEQGVGPGPEELDTSALFVFAAYLITSAALAEFIGRSRPQSTAPPPSPVDWHPRARPRPRARPPPPRPPSWRPKRLPARARALRCSGGTKALRRAVFMPRDARLSSVQIPIRRKTHTKHSEPT